MVNEFAVDLDVIAVARLGTKVGADLAVNRNPSGGDQLVAMPPRTEPGRGKKTVQAHREEFVAGIGDPGWWERSARISIPAKSF